MAEGWKYMFGKCVAVPHWTETPVFSVPTHFPGQQVPHSSTSLRTSWDHLALWHHGRCSLTEKSGPDQGRGIWGTKNTIPTRSYCALSLGTFVVFRNFLLLQILKYAMESKHFLEGWRSSCAKNLNTLSESSLSGSLRAWFQPRSTEAFWRTCGRKHCLADGEHWVVFQTNNCD